MVSFCIGSFTGYPKNSASVFVTEGSTSSEALRVRVSESVRCSKWRCLHVLSTCHGMSL